MYHCAHGLGFSIFPRQNTILPPAVAQSKESEAGVPCVPLTLCTEVLEAVLHHLCWVSKFDELFCRLLTTAKLLTLPGSPAAGCPRSTGRQRLKLDPREMLPTISYPQCLGMLANSTRDATSMVPLPVLAKGT